MSAVQAPSSEGPGSSHLERRWFGPLSVLIEAPPGLSVWLIGLARLALHLLCLLLHLYVSISRATERLTHFRGWVSEGSLM